jgi:hypothetical protein
MPIQITCPSCAQPIDAPETLAGKRVICPHCQGAVDIPVKSPASSSARMDDVHDEPVVVGALNIAKTAENDAQTADEKAALRVVRFIYVMFRDDWRRLFTCPLLWPGLFLFFLPWVDLSCSQRTLARQTGLQTTFGAYTLDPKFDKALGLERGLGIEKPKADDQAGWSVLSIMYIVFLMLGGFLGFVCIIFVLFRIRMFAAALHLFSLGLGCAAFFALGLQMIVGFPIERHARDHIEKARQRRIVQFGMRPGPEPDLNLLELETHYSPWLWISAALAFFATPMFLLEFSILLVLIIRHFRRPRLESG